MPLGKTGFEKGFLFPFGLVLVENGRVRMLSASRTKSYSDRFTGVVIVDWLIPFSA